MDRAGAGHKGTRKTRRMTFFLCNLGQDLASVNRSVTPWVIAMWHTPWYTSNAHHPMSEGTNMRLAMEDLLHTHEVGVAFNARTLTRT